MTPGLLRANGVCVPDWPKPFRFAHPESLSHARAFESFIASLAPDTEAWESLFTDEQRLHVFKVVYGNRKGKRRKPAVPTLFPAAS